MKKLFSLLLLVAMAMTAKAQTAQLNSVTVWLKNGEKVVYMLVQRPQVVQTGDELRLTVADVEAVYAVADVQRFTFDANESSAIDLPKAETGTAEMHMQTGRMVLTGLTAAETVGFYAASGQLLQQRRADASGGLTVDLDQLGYGLIIVKTNHQSFKITKK